MENKNKHKQKSVPTNAFLLYKKQPVTKYVTGCFGAAGRSRTGTVSLPADFESATSANSITAAKPTYLV